MAGPSRQLAGILRENGCRKVRAGKGTHEIWFSPINGRHVAVPRSTQSRHTANEVLKQAGSSESLLIMPATPLALAQALIRCPSVMPAEGGALGFLAQVLGDAGFEVHRPVFSAPGTPDVENLYARFGVGHPYLVFAGHTDVVPPGDEARWRHDPFGGI